MGLDRETTFTSYGHDCVEVRTPGGRTILIDTWFGARAADYVDACDVLLVTHGHSTMSATVHSVEVAGSLA